MQPIATMHENNVKAIKLKVDHIRTRQAELKQLATDLDLNADEIKKSKENVIRKLRQFVQDGVNQLDAEKNDKLQKVAAQKGQLQQEIEKIERTICQIENGMENLAPFELLQKQTEFDSIMSQLTMRPMSSFVSSPVSTRFQTDFDPQYSSGNDQKYFDPKNVFDLQIRLNQNICRYTYNFSKMFRK